MPTEYDRLSDLRHKYYRGIARINLALLTFEGTYAKEHRGLCDKNVRRLVKIFDLEGCRRLDEDNFISALIEPETLQRSLTKAGISELGWPKDGEIPFLSPDRIECLHGLHRVQAGKAYLDANDQWWTVRLYTEGLGPWGDIRVMLANSVIERESSIAPDIVEKFGNEQAYTDGHIFRRILDYQRQRDDISERKWWARLTSSKRRDLKQLLKDKPLASAFDRLSKFPGFWKPVRLGSLHRLLTLKCDEELLTNLNHIGDTWSLILQDTGLSTSVVDDATVEYLELRVPAISQADLNDLHHSLESEIIFSQVEDDIKRKILLKNLERVSCIIPSLKTFFENLKYLEPCCQILKHLLPMERPRTIRRELWAHYYRPDVPLVEYAEHDMRAHSRSTMEEERWLAYQQLWLFCLRHFSEMSTVLPRKEAKKPRPSPCAPNDACWQWFGDLAVSLGFRTPEAIRLQSQDPCLLLATRFLESAKSRSEKLRQEDVQAVAVVVRSLGVQRGSVIPSSFTTEMSDGDMLPWERRQGRPFEDDHLKDRPTIFLPFLYQDVSNSRGRDITSLFVKRDLITNFVGNRGEGTTHGFGVQTPSSPTIRGCESHDQACTTPACPHLGRVQELEVELRKKNEAVATQHEIMDRQNREFSESVAGIRNRLTTLDAHTTALQQQAKEAEAREASTKMLLEDRMNQCNAMADELNTDREKLDTLKQDLLQRESTIDSLRKQVANGQSERQMLQSTLEGNSERKSVRVHLEQTNETLRREYELLEQKSGQLIDEAGVRRQQLEEEMASQKQLIRDLKAKLGTFYQLVPEGEDVCEQFHLLQEHTSRLTNERDGLRQQLEQSQHTHQIELVKFRQEAEEKHERAMAELERQLRFEAEEHHRTKLDEAIHATRLAANEQHRITMAEKEQQSQIEKTQLSIINQQRRAELADLSAKNANLRQLLDEPASAVFHVQNTDLLFEEEIEDIHQSDLNRLLGFLRLGEVQLLESGNLEQWFPPLLSGPREHAKGFVRLESIRILRGTPYVRRARINIVTFTGYLQSFHQNASISNIDFVAFEPDTNRQLPRVDADKTRLALAQKYDGKTISICPRREFKEISQIRGKRFRTDDKDPLDGRRTRVRTDGDTRSSTNNPFAAEGLEAVLWTDHFHLQPGPQDRDRRILWNCSPD